MTETRLDKEKINRYFNNNVNDKYDPYINDVFCNSNKEEELKHLLARQFYDLLLEEDFNKKDLDHILYKIHYEINAKQVGKEGKKFAKILDWSLRIAGIILLPLAILWGVKGYLDGSSGIETWVEIKAPAWTRAQFSLPDGTTGWLNSNSSLKYNGNFKIDRQVILSGEAYFDVFKDSKRPFMVNANEVNVKVLGTRFNMASYENESSVEVVLEEGSLILYEKKMKKS
ncbi:MAG: FecR family protein, partial [Bacteroidales bacterium]